MGHSTCGLGCQAQTETHMAIHVSKALLTLFIHGDDVWACIALGMDA